MSYKLTLITFVICLISCTTKVKREIVGREQTLDSIQYYYDLAKTKTHSLKHRHININKALILAQNFEKDTLLLKILFRKIAIHSSLNQFDSLRYFNEILYENAAFVKNNHYLGKHYYLKGYYFNLIKKNPDSAFYCYNQSKNFFSKENDSSQVGRRLLAMAQIQQNYGDYFGSKETVTESLQYLVSEKDIRYSASAYSVLATNHRKLLNIKDAISYYNKAISLTNSSKDALIYRNNLSATYIDNKEYAKAIVILEALKKNNLDVSLLDEARAVDNLFYTKWQYNKSNVESNLLKALKIRTKYNDKRGQIASYTHLAEYFLESNRKAALQWIDKSIKISKELKSPKGELDALKLFMKIAPQSIKIKDRFIFLRDSLYEQELRVKTQFAKIKYDDKLKQEKILKLGKENSLKETELLKEKNQKLVYLIALVFFVFIGGFVWYFFNRRNKALKQKNKIDKLEASYKERIKFSKKIHDSFAATIYNLMLLVKKGAEQSKILEQLDKVYNQSRDFSRENNEINVKENFVNELLSMLSSYIPSHTQSYIVGHNKVDWSLFQDLDKIAIYLTLQELMINMQRHSHADLVTVTFVNKNEFLIINYFDDGVGASIIEMSTKNGLKNTESRITAINGTIIFDTEKNQGFKVEIRIPN